MQYTHNSLAAEVVQPLEALVALVLVQQVVALSKDIQEEAQPSTQVENIKDKVGTIFKAYSKAAKDKVDKVDKAKLPELLVEEVVRTTLPAIPTIWEPMAAVPKLELKVINLLNKLIFTTQYTSKLIYSININVKFNDLFN